ncbi:structure-specific endonuclease subunit slx1 [Striga asiatica]|uniref:Structure-specific endonuclease subunit slx1 n=1 Tax=Striga asiatica TaxID=4170 RepID=A0A5A7QU84_STRAF|nr:structure-specific endonuclease subunit slx1 [Striga asiatica]
MTKMLSATFKSVKPHSKSLPFLLPLSRPINSSENQSRISPRSSPKRPSPYKILAQSSPEKPSSSTILPEASPKNPPSSVPRFSRKTSWVVYLILSTNPPIRTYVGVTNNFSTRLKQHNGELKGGAKASRSGRPWICACLVQGFRDKNTAYAFESKWKSISRKLPRKQSSKNQKLAESSRCLLLKHRYAALNKVVDLIDCDCLKINWHLNPV